MSSVGGEISSPPSGAQLQAGSRLPMKVAAVGAAVRRKLGANVPLTVGVAMFLAIAIVGAFAGFFAPHDPIKQNVEEALLPPGSTATPRPMARRSRQSGFPARRLSLYARPDG